MATETKPRLRVYAACYALWGIVLVLALISLELWRETILDLVIRHVDDLSSQTSTYDVLIVVLGLGLTALTIFAEPYLRGGIRRRRLLPRFGHVAVPLAAFAAAAWVVRALA